VSDYNSLDKGALDRWITRENPAAAEWEERLDGICDQLADATDDQLEIIEAVLDGDDWDKVMGLVHAYWMKHFMPRPKGPSVVSMLDEDTPCPTCGGNGGVDEYNPVTGEMKWGSGECPTCHGKGRV
jgi:hypothetical protein